MPRLSCWFIRAALIYLIAGFSLGALLLVQKASPIHPALWRLLPAHVEFLLFGWVAQLTMGVAYWILPRFRPAPVRGKQGLAWLAFGLLNTGVMLAAMAPVITAPPLVTLLGRSAEAGAALAFALHAWPRVKSTEVTLRRTT